MRKLNHRTKAVILTILLAILFCIIYACGMLISEDAVVGSFMEAKQAPSLTHLFGTDALGRDLFLRTLKGLSVSITVGLVASVISAIVAVLVGIVVGDVGCAVVGLVVGGDEGFTIVGLVVGVVYS